MDKGMDGWRYGGIEAWKDRGKDVQQYGWINDGWVEA